MDSTKNGPKTNYWCVPTVNQIANHSSMEIIAPNYTSIEQFEANHTHAL